MTCRDVDDLILSYASGARVAPEAVAHITQCERCRKLAQAIGQAPQAAEPRPEKLRQITAGVLADLKPVNPIAPTGLLSIGLLVIFGIVVAGGAMLYGVAGWLALSPIERVAVFVVLASMACLLAFSVIRQVVPGSRLLAPPNLQVAGVLAIVAGTIAVLFRPHPEATFVATGLVCLRIGVECAVPCALLSWFVLRRGAMLTPLATGATAGALAGLSGLTVLEILCPNLNEFHILVWHLGAVLASIAGGILIATAAGYFRLRKDRQARS